jgi:hypothetical protein
MVDTENQSYETWVVRISNEPKFYNPYHRILRIIFRGGQYDIKCNPGFSVPNSKRHLVLAHVPPKYFEVNDPLTDDRLQFLPGLLSKAGALADLPRGWCELMSIQQEISTGNPGNASAGFTISNTNMFDLENVSLAVTAPLSGRDYTTTVAGDNSTGDLNNLGFGLFINNQDTVVLKGPGGSITIGKEGIHIGGRLATESSTRDTGFLSDNTISDIVGSMFATAAAAWPKMPNMGQIASIANAASKFISITSAATEVSNLLV